MVVYTFEITGVTGPGLLQNKFDALAMITPQPTGPRKANKPTTPEEMAWAKAYYYEEDEDGDKLEKPEFWHPSSAVYGAIINASSNHKVKGSRKSLKSLAPGALIMRDDKMPLTMPGTHEPITEFVLDCRAVVNPSTKGRMACIRPCFPRWVATGEIEIDDETLDPTLVKQLLDEAGRSIGIGDFRPQKCGPFGRFTVTLWQPSPD